MRHYILKAFSLPLFLLALATSCSEDSAPEANIPDVLVSPEVAVAQNSLKDVCLQWGESKTMVSEVMGEYSKTFLDENTLICSKDEANAFISYQFVDKQLVAAVVTFDHLVDEASLLSCLNNYEYLGMLGGCTLYSNSELNSLCAIYSCAFDDTEYSIVGFTPIVSDKLSLPKTITVTIGKEASYSGKAVSFNMIPVEGGTFQMGATAEQKNGYTPNSGESPVHTVTLSDYYIGETEVTQALWYAVMGAKPSSSYSWSSAYGLGDNYPAYYISYDECKSFITKLNTLTGAAFRMPTEAEWEYAARGGKKSQGYVFSGSNTIGDVAWYTVNSYDKGSSSPDYGTHPVGTKQPNELGIYDMSGNVWEWCSDWYGSYSSSSQTNPTGATSGSYRVKRGGSWGSDATCCRVACRSYNSPGGHGYDHGLRLALSSN